ncbi:MAG: class I SAM-dependent methyltransferase [Candidatus Eisenbacteria bacterium]|nr:class I SAM-dependent methyltransferase [Candidatus Eisenbacteria bacterium]
MDIGCAVCKLYAVLDERFPVEYVGIDHDPEFIRVAHERYGNRSNFQVRCTRATDTGAFAGIERPDLVCALETLEHIPERDSIRIIDSVSRLAPRRFVCSVPVEVGPALWIKNVGSLLLGYERHKQRPWREVFWAGIYQLNRLPPHRTGHAGFDWRWLAQTIRHFMHVRELRKSPVPFLPAAFAFSVMFVAEPWPEAHRD